MNYLLTTLRSLRKRRLYSGLNVAGLAIGLTCFLIIASYVRDELAFDRFHDKSDRIVRVGMYMPRALSPHWATAIYPYGELLTSELPEVEDAVRIQRGSDRLVATDLTRDYEERFFYVEPSFFEIFDFEPIEGDASALARPNTVFLTPAIAAKYFGSEHAVGKRLTIDNERELEVVGLVRPAPRQSHIQFDALVSLETMRPVNEERPWNRLAFTYLLLREDHDPDAFESALEAFRRTHVEPRIGEEAALTLIPLTRIRLFGRFDSDIQPQGDVRYVLLFSAVALLVLLIACVNYVNLATARSAERAREVGVRKAVGATRGNLVRQFLGESALFTVAGLAIALALVIVVRPFAEALLDRPLPIGFDPTFLAILGLSLITVALVSGAYPAFVLSRVAPASIFRGALVPRATPGFRRMLVVFQFAAAIVLIAATMVVERQLRYVQYTHPGFDRENLLVIETRGELEGQAEAFKAELLRHAGIEHVSLTCATPARQCATAAVRSGFAEGFEPDEDELIVADINWGDYEYARTLGLEFVEGRDFSPDLPTDGGGAIINETARGLFGWEEPLGKTVWGHTVIGVVRDFHIRSMRDRVRPMLLVADVSSHGRVLARVRPGAVPDVLDYAESTWNAFVPTVPFQYSFLDQDFEAMYRAERRLGSLFLAFTSVAVLLACMGLFGLAAFTAQQRTKEIGIRKVLGATSGGIIRLLSMEFARLVIAAAVVAAPITYVGTSRWLEEFAYRAPIGFEMSLFAGLAALTIAMLAVSYHAWRAAAMNPAESLRYE